MKNKKAIIGLIAVIVLVLVAVGVLIAVLSSGDQTKDPTDASTATPTGSTGTTATTPTKPTESEPSNPVVNEPKDYDNGVVRKPTTVDKVILSNDFSEKLDPLVEKEYQKTSYFGSTATLEDGWLHLTSTEHLFVYGTHLWGEYGGVSFNTGKTYSVSFDLKKGTGTEHSNDIFTLTLAEEAEGQDPRFGDQLKQVVIDFSNYDEMVAFNSDKGTFAHVVFDAETGICHIEVRFTVDRGTGNHLLYARDATGYNDWFIDNFNISEITEDGSDFEWIVEDNEKTYDCEINTGRGSVTVRKELLNEHFNTADSIKLENGGRTAFAGPSSIRLDHGMVRLTTNQHLFTFGAFKDWGYFGGVNFLQDHSYVMSFDLKLGDARTQKVFNLYVMQEDDPDPRFGTALYTLQLDFSDLYRQMDAGEENYFVKVNTNNFASVKYNSRTRIAHIEIRFTRTVDLNVQVVSKGMGDNEWLVDNMYIGDTTKPIEVDELDYDNGVSFDGFESTGTTFENDFSEDANKGVDQAWEQSAFVGSTAALQDGWVHITSNEHVFVFGGHTWANYGGVAFDKDTYYKISFDLKLGSNGANPTFNLYVMTENGDPRFGDIVKTLTLNFKDFKNFVTTNTDSFAFVTYTAETHTAHIEILFKTDASKHTDIVSKCVGENDWLMDNLKIEKMKYTCPGHVDANNDGICDVCGQELVTVVEKDYSNGVTFDGFESTGTTFENDFSEDANKGVIQEWEKSAFMGSTAALRDGWVRITSNEHVFVYGGHTWGNFGSVSFAKDAYYKVSFDLKLGSDGANRTFNLYVMTENGDPRFGDIVKTLTLNFEDFENFVTTNTDSFASVTYTAATHTAHIEILFKTDASKHTDIVSRCAGDNDWLMDNLKMEKMKEASVEKDYSNGVTFDGFESTGTTFENDFSVEANKGVDQAWEQSAFMGSTAALQDGWVRITSDEHVFVFGGHTWAFYGSVSFDKDAYYKVSFDLKLGSDGANRTFNLYVMTENGDPRFGDIVKTLTLNFEDFENFVTTNTNNFASVTYTAATHTAHIEILFKTDANLNTDIVSRCVGQNDWLMDNLKIETMEEVQAEKDYSNGVTFDGFTCTGTTFENDFSEDVNKGVDQAWEQSAFMGSTAALQDGWVRITSDEHVFVFGGHTWAFYGSVSFDKDAYYKVSFDLKLGSDSANRTFNLYVMTENGDPRFGDIVKTLTLNFEDFENFVTTNTDSFASVTYTAATHTAHIEILFKTDANLNTDVVSRCVGQNDWLMDNLKMEKMKEASVEKDYSNGVTFDGFTSTGTTFENDFSEDANKGVTQAWHKTAFNGSTAALENGWVRITSDEHVFVFGGHTWAFYGSVSFDKDAYYKVSFDLKLGSDTANRTFNLYVMTENGDPRFGDIVKTLTLNFEDFENFVTTNTDGFASVTYTAETHTAHIEILFKTDASKNTDIVSRCAGDNDWLMDNLKIETMKEVQAEQDYSNGVTFDGFESTGTAFENDFSEDANKGVDQAWEQSAFNGSTAALENGWVHITSTEHVFVFGGHTWANYGGIAFDKDAYYKVSFDLKLGSDTANRTFNLYVMTENGDPRFGDIVKTLTLNFEDIENFVTTNTDSFASVTYTAATHTAHIEILFKTDANLNTDIVSRCVGQNDWLMDNLKIETCSQAETNTAGLGLTALLALPAVIGKFRFGTV